MFRMHRRIVCFDCIKSGHTRQNLRWIVRLVVFRSICSGLVRDFVCFVCIDDGHRRQNEWQNLRWIIRLVVLRSICRGLVVYIHLRDFNIWILFDIWKFVAIFFNWDVCLCLIHYIRNSILNNRNGMFIPSNFVLVIPPVV